MTHPPNFRSFAYAGFHAFTAFGTKLPRILIMKKLLEKLMVSPVLVIALKVHGQGYIYDQESATTPLYINYDSFVISRMMLYESFVPTLSSIDFVQLEISDYPDTSTSGAALSVAIWSGSPQDPTFIGGSERVDLPANFHNDGIAYSGIVTFDFATAISLTPGETYYIVPVEITGDDVWSVAVTDNTYSNGGLYGFDGTDLWFREGETVPEPSDAALGTMGGLLIAGILGFKGKMQQQLKSQNRKA